MSRLSSSPKSLHPVRARRQALGYTQTMLSERCRVARYILSMIEVHAHCPTYDVQQRIATALGVPMEELFGPYPVVPVLTPNDPLPSVPTNGYHLPETPTESLIHEDEFC